MNDSESAAHVDSLIETRIERADAYLQQHLENQKMWYSDKVSQYKSYSQYLSFVVIASGAAIPFIQIFEALFGAGALRRHDRTAGLGEVVVIAKGAERIGKFEETWLSYRKAAERMKREYRLYANGAGAYREVPDENERRYGERATTRVRYADRAGLLTLRRAEPVGIIH